LRKKSEQKGDTARNVPPQVALQRELDAFLRQPNLPVHQASLGDCDAGTSSDVCHSDTPLQWWAANKDIYPMLSQVARLLLAVPATSVSSERLFSKAGAIISDRRSKLSPQHAEQLCFLSQNWLD
jgi:hypothetical protein